MTTNDIIDAFRAAMADAGIIYTGVINPDGNLHRFDVDGDKRASKTGFYTLYADGVPAGNFGCWKRGISENWCAKQSSTMTDTERSQWQQRIDAARKQREQDQHERQERAAELANLFWDSATPATAHPYLTRKNVKSYGLRVGTWRKYTDAGEPWLEIENALLIPIRRGKIIRSMQAIFTDKNNLLERDKDFLSGGQKHGCYFRIGDLPDKADRNAVLVICEGYATGATIHEATGYPVFVAFDAGNLEPVASRVRETYGVAKILIAADNDRWTLQPIENPGVHFASLAADRVRGLVAIPEFDNTDSRPTDFNDLAAMHGQGEVRKQIHAVLQPLERIEQNAIEVMPPSGPDMSLAMMPLRECNTKGKPLATIENFAEIMSRLNVIIRYNVIKKEEEILIPGEAFSIDNQANASLAWIISWCKRFGFETSVVGDFITYMADQNLHNPVANWIQSKSWDGRDHLQALFNSIKATGEDDHAEIRHRKEFLMRRWMISAVAAAFSPFGVSAHGVLVFQGDQYLGKTKWFKQLVPDELGVIADGMMLKPDDKDSVKQAVSNWLVELGELDATFRKADIAQLKSFITRDRDVLRRAYAKKESTFARRTVFFASVNPREFLHDQTGNRRYWTIECEAIDHNHGIDMQQCWAQVYESLFAKGESWFLTPDEMHALNDSNRAFEVIDPIQDRISTSLAWDAPPIQWRWMRSTQVLIECGVMNPTQAEATRAALYLRKMIPADIKGTRRTGHGNEYFVPPRYI